MVWVWSCAQAAEPLFPERLVFVGLGQLCPLDLGHSPALGPSSGSERAFLVSVPPVQLSLLDVVAPGQSLAVQRELGNVMAPLQGFLVLIFFCPFVLFFYFSLLFVL